MKTINLCRILLLLSMTCSFLVFANTPIDENIEDVIRSEINLDEFIISNDIQVYSHNGIVTLQGTVNSEAEKQKVIDIAISASGVNAVHIQNLRIFVPE